MIRGPDDRGLGWPRGTRGTAFPCFAHRVPCGPDRRRSSRNRGRAARAPRFQVPCRSTTPAIAFVAFAWSLQHAFMPLTFEAKFMAFRLLSSVPNTVFQTLLYLRVRRLVPFAIAHALMDGASVLIGVLLPLVRA